MFYLVEAGGHCLNLCCDFDGATCVRVLAIIDPMLVAHVDDFGGVERVRHLLNQSTVTARKEVERT